MALCIGSGNSRRELLGGVEREKMKKEKERKEEEKKNILL